MRRNRSTGGRFVGKNQEPELKKIPAPASLQQANPETLVHITNPALQTSISSNQIQKSVNQQMASNSIQQALMQIQNNGPVMSTSVQHAVATPSGITIPAATSLTANQVVHQT